MIMADPTGAVSPESRQAHTRHPDVLVRSGPRRLPQQALPSVRNHPAPDALVRPCRVTTRPRSSVTRRRSSPDAGTVESAAA